MLSKSLKKQLIFNHLRKLKQEFQSHYPVYIARINTTRLWFNIGGLTRNITAYHDLLRLWADFWDIDIYRKDNDAAAGVYLVGNSDILEYSREALALLIGKCERLTSNLDTTKLIIPPAAQRATYRGDCIMLYMSNLHNWINAKTITHTEFKNQRYKSQCSRNEYARDTPLLSDYKKFNKCRIDFSNS